MSWGRKTPAHTHRAARNALNFAAGVALAVGGVLGAKYLQQQPQAPQPQPVEQQAVATEKLDLTQPHIVKISLDDYGTGVADIAVARVADLREDMYRNLLQGVPKHLHQYVWLQKSVRDFTDGIVDEYAERLPELREGFATAIRAGSLGESRILCVATSLSEGQTLQDLLHNMTGLKMRDAALPLTMPEFRQLVADHEYAHCFTPEMNVPVVRETLSDAYALAQYVQRTGDMQLPYLYQDIRTAGFVQNPADSHATNLFLSEFLSQLETAYAAGELEGLQDGALMEKLQNMVLGAPAQREQRIGEMTTTALKAATEMRMLHRQMFVNPYTCHLQETDGQMVIVEEGSISQRLIEAHQAAVENICGHDRQNRPTRAQLYTQDLESLLAEKSPEKQAEILAFQQWKINAVERELTASGERHRAQMRDGYGLRLEERREVLEKVATRANINLQPATPEQEPSV